MNITIPPAALEAGARALARYNCEQWDNDPDRWRVYFADEARAAFLAILENWPGMERERIGKGYEWPLTEEYTDIIILPLPPQENSDDQ